VNEKGEVLETVDVEVVGSDSKVLEFLLSDGSIALIRFTITRAARAVRDYSPISEPFYFVEFRLDRRIKNIAPELCVSPDKAKARQASKRGGPEVA